MIEKRNIFSEPIGFHMESKNDGTHSLTKEELAVDLKNKRQQAIEEVRKQRKKYIYALLKYHKIDESKIDIDAILNGNIPDWLKRLSKETPVENLNLNDNKIIYFQLESGLVIKIDYENNSAYRFNIENQEWNEDVAKFNEYEYGELHGKPISFDDIYPIGEPFHYGRQL